MKFPDRFIIVLFVLLSVLISSCSDIPVDTGVGDADRRDSIDAISEKKEMQPNLTTEIEQNLSQEITFNYYPEAYLYFIEKHINEYPLTGEGCDEAKLLSEIILYLKNNPYIYRTANKITHKEVIEEILDKTGCGFEPIMVRAFNDGPCYFERFFNLSELENLCYDFMNDSGMIVPRPLSEQDSFPLNLDIGSFIPNDSFCSDLKDLLERGDVFDEFFTQDDITYNIFFIKYNPKDEIPKLKVQAIFDCYSFVKDPGLKSFFEGLVDEFIVRQNNYFPEYTVENFKEFCSMHNFCDSGNFSRFTKVLLFKPEVKCDFREDETGCIFFADPANKIYSDLSSIRLYLMILEFKNGAEKLNKSDEDFLDVKVPIICAFVSENSSCENLPFEWDGYAEICYILKGENCNQLDGLMPFYEEFCEQIGALDELKKYIQGLYC